MEPGRNRDLLVETLSDNFEVQTAADPASLESEFECCVFDQPTFDRFDGIAKSKRDTTNGVFLPYVLLVPHDSTLSTDTVVWEFVDDVIELPVEKAELKARIGNQVHRSRVVTHLAERERLLTRQNERLDEFASVVSHDLRNPLNVAAGRLELAREACSSEHLDAVAQAHERMEELITDLLTLAKQGEQVSEKQTIDLAELAHSCWDTVETAEAELAIDDAPSIQGDQSRVQQLFENLIRNAIEHGGEDVTITVGALEDGFYVADDGVGLPEDQRDDIFESGYSTSNDGTGFGLSIVREIAQAHDWSIGATECPDGGLRFEITGIRTTQN